MKPLSEKAKARMVEKGIEKGIQQGESMLLIRLLERRFGPLSEDRKVRIREAASETLMIWGDRLMSANSVEEIMDADSDKP